MTNTEAIRTLKDDTWIQEVNEDGTAVLWTSYADKFTDALDLAIAALERDRWISERPPQQDEATGYVLAVVDGKCGAIKFDGALVLAEYDPEYGDWFLDEYPNAVFKVKAWRPLPEPPKEET